MKPFNLEEYLANPSRKVVTRDGRSVRIICTDRKDLTYPVVALNETESRENLACYTKDGRYFTGVSHDYDLFFAPEKHEGWVNIYKERSDRSLGARIYPTKKDAKKEVNKWDDYVTTVKIEWEE